MDFYKDIQARTGGEVYIGVVGPVRSGKSTFIKRFMDTAVLPNIADEALRERTRDELPQSSAGKTIMTTEPKFVPEQGITVELGDSAELKVRLIDCVGFIMPSAIGYIEENEPRMVRTPWFEEPIPFNMAAEIGTQKVITEHSTLGVVITSDGSITDIPREEYREAEERVIDELQKAGKPYVMILNTVYPDEAASRQLASDLSDIYGVPVLPLNCLDLTEDKIKEILGSILYMFPVNEVSFAIPDWVLSLENDNWLKSAIISSIKSNFDICKVHEIKAMVERIASCQYISALKLERLDLGAGCCEVSMSLKPDLFYQILGERTGMTVKGESDLYNMLVNMNNMEKQFSKIRDAWDQVNTYGYGIVMPGIDELSLEEPKIIKQNGKYGVKLRATAPSIHMMKTNICTEITPIVGSEAQSEEIIAYLMNEFEGDPVKIWDSNIFGKSLNELVNEGLHNKLAKMPDDARNKVRETIERVINDGCSGLICIIL